MSQPGSRPRSSGNHGTFVWPSTLDPSPISLSLQQIYVPPVTDDTIGVSTHEETHEHIKTYKFKWKYCQLILESPRQQP